MRIDHCPTCRTDTFLTEPDFTIDGDHVTIGSHHFMAHDPDGDVVDECQGGVGSVKDCVAV